MDFKMKKLMFLINFIMFLLMIQCLFAFAENETNPIEEGLPEPELYEEESKALNEVDNLINDDPNVIRNETGNTTDVKDKADVSSIDKILDNPIYMIIALIVAIIILGIFWKLAKLAFKIGLIVAVVLFLIWIVRQFMN